MGAQIDKTMVTQPNDTPHTPSGDDESSSTDLNVHRVSHLPSVWNPIMSMYSSSDVYGAESSAFRGMCDVIRFSGSAEEHRNKRSMAMYERDRLEETKDCVHSSRIRVVVPPSELPRLQKTRPNKKRNRSHKKSCTQPRLFKRRATRACLKCHARKIRCTCSQTEKDKAEVYWRRKRGIVAEDSDIIETVEHTQCCRDALCTRPNRHPGHCKFPWRKSRVRKRPKNGSKA